MRISSAYVYTVISTHTPSRKNSRNSHKLRDLPRSAPPLLLRRLGALRLILTLVCGLLAEPAAAQTPPMPACAAADTAVTAAITDTTKREALAKDCTVLLGIKDTLIGTGANAGSLNWAKGLSMASWTGVKVNSDGRVTELRLPVKRLTGTIPIALSELTGLTIIHLDNNRLTGTIPDLSALTGLTILNLHVNRLTGGINADYFPSSLVQLSLERQRPLKLPFAQATTGLTGSIPDLSKLINLAILRLNNNGLRGSIPDLSALEKLTHLHLNNNRLDGHINASHFPPRSLSSWSSSTSNQSMTVSTTALPVQVTQMKSCPVTCTSTGQVRTACVYEVDVTCCMYCSLSNSHALTT